MDAATPSIRISGATLHNLRKVDARIPLGRLSVVTGVSGSGKSSLARDVLLRNLQRLLARRPRGGKAPDDGAAVEGCGSIEGWQPISRVLEVDQTPIGKTPRSCPATYIGFWDSIRRLYAETTDARIRGFTASRFSFNTAGGRCEACEGQGMQRIEMSFLPDVQVLCDVCGGRRFNQETLSILFKGKSIGEMLALSVDDAVEFFAAQRSVQHPLQLLGRRRPRIFEPGAAEPDALGRGKPENQAGRRAREICAPTRSGSTSRAAKASTPCTCSTSRPSACTWRTSRSW